MSLTFVASLAALLAQVLLMCGIEVEVQAIQTTLNTIITIVAAALAMYGRWRLGDINAAGMRKDQLP